MKRGNIIKIVVILVIELLSIGMIGCKNRKPIKIPKTNDTIGRFVYIDRMGILHTENGCKAVYKDHNMQMVKPVYLSDISEYNLDRICSQCVKEDHITRIKEVIEEREYRVMEDTIAEDDPDIYDPMNDDSFDENNKREKIKIEW